MKDDCEFGRKRVWHVLNAFQNLPGGLKKTTNYRQDR